ncbi:MAG: hypothetical protein MUF12_07270 [Sediminibacterium sp.]|jgi:hypothetical protein|nr:hypothetical protein [Sediminibacterium sp.]
MKPLFYSTAKLLTVPCAILPMLLAVSSLMSIREGGMLFKNDYFFFGLFYVIYIVGLWQGYLQHKQVVTWIVFFTHVLALSTFVVVERDLFGYVAVITLILTSATQQYHRMKYEECSICG